MSVHLLVSGVRLRRSYNVRAIPERVTRSGGAGRARSRTAVRVSAAPWQVGGLALFLYVGSPQSREGDERKEAKLDQILKMLDPDKSEELIAHIDARFARE
jgi:hypothetical protein